MSDSDIRNIRGLKHRDMKPCIFCGKGMMHAGGIAFYKIKIERCVVDVREVQRAAGMEMMMGGLALLANIMGPDADLAKVLPHATDGLVCDDCAIMKNECIAQIVERVSDKEEAVGTEAAK